MASITISLQGKTVTTTFDSDELFINEWIETLAGMLITVGYVQDSVIGAMAEYVTENDDTPLEN